MARFFVPTDFHVFFMPEYRGNNLVYMSRFRYRFEMLTGSKTLDDNSDFFPRYVEHS